LVDGALWPPGLKEPAKRLRAVFRTDFQRDIRRIALPAGALEAERASVLIEAAWDRGHISTQGIHPEKVEEICEVELELKQGEPEALFDFALAAAAGLALFPWDMSKAERGYRLLGLSSGRKAASPGGLCVGETTEALFLSCMNGAIGFWIRKVERFYHAGACEYLRDTLAAIQDMGRLLSFFRPLLHDEDRRAWDSAFGHAAERLRRRLGIVSGAVAETVPAWDEADAAMVLSMVRWVYCRGWRDRWDVRHRRMASLPPSLFFGERIDQYKRWFAEADRRWRN
jgi:inorganic triphosphatase YgiF